MNVVRTRKIPSARPTPGAIIQLQGTALQHPFQIPREVNHRVRQSKTRIAHLGGRPHRLKTAQGKSQRRFNTSGICLPTINARPPTLQKIANEIFHGGKAETGDWALSSIALCPVFTYRQLTPVIF